MTTTITTQTFALNKDSKAELVALASALDLIGKKRYTEAAAVLISRRDELTKNPALKPYDPREP